MALAGREDVERVFDGLQEVVNSSGRCLAQKGLYLGEGVVDRIEVGALGRQAAQLCPSRFYGLADGNWFVGGQVIHDDDVAGRECRDKDLLNIGQDGRPVHWPIEDHGCGRA